MAIKEEVEKEARKAQEPKEAVKSAIRRLCKRYGADEVKAIVSNELERQAKISEIESAISKQKAELKNLKG